MLRRSLLAAVGLLVLVSPAAAQDQSPATASNASPTPPALMEEPQVGDHWTYEFHDEITGELKWTYTVTVTDVSPTELGIRLSTLGKAGFTYQTFDRSWNFLDSGTWRYKPNDGTGIQTPLSLGKTWSIKATDSNSGTGASWRRSGSAKVTAKESVTTRAGTFETFRIETSVEDQKMQDHTRLEQSEQQTWYAPSINHWVKRTYLMRSGGKVRQKNSIELIEYGRRS